MSPREVVRRLLIWTVVVGYFVAAGWQAAHGSWTGLLGFAAFPVVGAIILMSRPRNGVGWWLWGIGLAYAVTGWGYPGGPTEQAPVWIEAATVALGAPFWILLPGIGLLFPTGRPENRRGRVLLTVLLALVAVFIAGGLFDYQPLPSGRLSPWALPRSDLLDALFAAVFPLTVACFVGIAADVALRWRVAPPAARAQFSWFFFGLSPVVLFISTALLSELVPVLNGLNELGVAPALMVLFNLVPISIGVAITRHGLYAIGRVVSRTVSYATVTVLAIAVYASVVTVVSQLVPDQSSLAVAAATLIAAAVCLPALRWLRRIVDRRFDRERYDAEQVVDAFGERLRASVDSEATSADLVAAVERTLQPSAVGIWTAGESR